LTPLLLLCLSLHLAPRSSPLQIDMVIENNASAIRALEPLAEEIAALKAFSTGELLLRQRLPATAAFGRCSAGGCTLPQGTHSPDCNRLCTTTRILSARP